MRAQLAIAGGDRPAALALLHSLPEDPLRHQPAVVATVVAIQVSSCAHSSVAEAGSPSDSQATCARKLLSL